MPAGEPKTVARPEPTPAPEELPQVLPAPMLPSFTPDTEAREMKLKALIHDLENGKTCPERKAAIADLVALGDANAVPALKKARYRMRGGVLGIGSSNANHCLKPAAEAAIKALGGKLK